MSAVFCASRGMVKTLRQSQSQPQPNDEEWNTVLGSGVAGAVFSALARKGPVAMGRGALLYGGTMFVLHPHLWKSGLHAMMLTPPLDDGVATCSGGMSWCDGFE